jgi:hypothetical protein
MSLSNLAAIGNFISGIAVFSFILLSLQIRQSNKNQRSLIQQGRSSRRVELFLRRAEPYFSDILIRAQQGDFTLEAGQIASCAMITQAIFEGYEDTFLQHRAGAIDHSSWNTELLSVRRYFTYPVTRATWRMMRDGFADDFRDFGDSLMKETKGAKLGDMVAQWKAALQEELE